MRRAPFALAAAFALTTTLAACGSDTLDDVLALCTKIGRAHV